ncbi:SdpI family protein [Taibaiella lutea]|nr:SdpI family protein [Taibaiella lutea]
MKIHFKKEIFYWLLCILPYVFLSWVYASLPQTVPTHFGIDGKANGWSSKESLWFIPASLSLMMYLLFLVIPRIDPKQRLQQGGKFEKIRFIVLLFITAIACITIYISYKQNIGHTGNFLFAGIGLFFAVLGNFFPALKPNYFIGIRSPWALENEIVWKKTHQLAGKIWVVAGLFLAVLPFILNNEVLMNQIFLIVTLSIAFFPFIYSYIIWRQEKKRISA